jgi:segregation and condensation protein A
MDIDISGFHSHTYTVSTPVYAGPLDLLLQLIQRAELDITKVALAQVTDQYLEYLKSLDEHLVEEVSSFLVIAAKLLQIKSEVLLPRPPVRMEGEEDAGEALARQLIIYKRFKEIAEHLGHLELAGNHTYLRLAPPPKIETSLDLSGVTIVDLASVAHRVLSQSDHRLALGTVVTPPRVTIREKIHNIIGTLQRAGKATFKVLLEKSSNRLEVVVTFLAMLELIKRHLVNVKQEQLFGEIELEPTGILEDDDSFELEFGE